MLGVLIWVPLLVVKEEPLLSMIAIVGHGYSHPVTVANEGFFRGFPTNDSGGDWNPGWGG